MALQRASWVGYSKLKKNNMKFSGKRLTHLGMINYEVLIDNNLETFLSVFKGFSHGSHGKNYVECWINLDPATFPTEKECSIFKKFYFR